MRLRKRAFLKSLAAAIVGAGASQLAAPEEAEAAYTAGGATDGGDLVNTHLTVQGNLGVGASSSHGARLQAVGAGRVAWLEASSGALEVTLARAGLERWALRNLNSDDSFRLTAGVQQASTFDPTSIASCRGHWVVHNGCDVSTDGAAIGALNDRSTNGYHLTQATAGYKPLYKTNRVNGYAAALFDGADDFLTRAFSLPMPVTLFVVARQVSWTAGRWLIDGNGNTYTLAIVQRTGSPTLASASGGGSPVDWSGTSPAVGSWFLASFNATGSAVKSWLNRNSVVNAAGGATGPGGITLGAAGSTLGCGNVEFAEVALYAATLSDQDRAAVEEHLMAKYALAGGGGSGAQDRLTVLPDGRLGVGTAAPGSKLDVAGDLNATGPIRINGVVVIDANGNVVGASVASQSYYAP